MITPERIAEIEKEIKRGYVKDYHEDDCDNLMNVEEKCNCIYGLARELVSELKESLAREEKNREQIYRFAKKLTGWIEEQIS